VASAVLPPLVAFVVEREVWSDGSPWSLFYPAVVVSAWLGEAPAGIIATILSVGLAWIFLIQPAYVVLKDDPIEAASAVLFVAVGIAVSTWRERERRATVAGEEALATTSKINEHLKRALAERRMFAALVENSSDFIGLATPAGVPTYINPAGRRLIGLSHDFPLAEAHFADFHPVEIRPVVESEVMPALAGVGQWQGESWFRDWTTDRAIPVWLTHFAVREIGSDKILGIATVTRDMSAVKQARDELEAVKERWHNATLKLAEAQRVAHVGSWSYDVASGHVEWSDELFRIFGRDPGGPVPRIRGPEPIYTPESRRAVEHAVDKIRRDGEPYELDLELIRPDKTTRLVAARGAATRNEAGEVIRITGTAQDVTELRQLQRQREEWMSVIAHDLRQPIGVISMSADMLPDLHRGQVDDTERTIISRIGHAAHGLSRMVNDMLDASRIEAHRMSLERMWVEPTALVRATLTDLEYLIAETELAVSADPDLPRVYADPGRIEQVLGNLISNAIKYGDRERGIDIHVRRAPGEVSIAVVNRGKGLSPDEVETVFNRFARARRARTSKTEGLGLGLYIAKGLIEAHGGQLWCESVPNERTAFVFTLPTSMLSESAAA
jgi:PAS domain S-box-containing protein